MMGACPPPSPARPAAARVMMPFRVGVVGVVRWMMPRRRAMTPMTPPCEIGSDDLGDTSTLAEPAVVDQLIEGYGK